MNKFAQNQTTIAFIAAFRSIAVVATSFYTTSVDVSHRVKPCSSAGSASATSSRRLLVYFVGSNTNYKGFPMKKKNWQFLSGLCAIVMAGAWAAPACAQSGEVTEKPRLYTYEAFWVVPRARWAEFEKVNPAQQKVMDRAIASGVLVSYGSDSALLHDADGATHDNR